MKIGYIHSQGLVLEPTGPSIHVQEICSALQRLGHDVFIVTNGKGEKEQMGPQSFKIYETSSKLPLPILHRLYEIRNRIPRKSATAQMATILPPTDGFPLTWSPTAMMRDLEHRVAEWRRVRHFYQQAQVILSAELPDVLYERYNYYGIAGGRLAKRVRLPLIIEFNGAPALEVKRKNRVSPLYEIMVRQVERKIFRQADMILTVAPALKRYVLALGVPENKVEVMLNAVPEAWLDAQKTQAELIKARYGLDGNIVVGFMGTMRSYHDVSLLLGCAKQVLEQCPHIRFFLLGDGPFRDVWEAQALGEGLSDKFIFTGSVIHDQVPDYIDAMDICVATYPTLHSIGFSLKVFEYMAMGKPVIITHLEDTEYVITHRQNGILVEPGDEQQLRAAILELAKDITLRERLGNAARKTAEKYTWIGNARRIAELFEAFLQKKRNKKTHC